MLSDTKRDCVTQASLLGDYQSMGINFLADMYCDAKDNNKEQQKSSYMAALLLRFWYTIDKIYLRSASSGVDREECFMWLYEAIEYACKYRAWRDPERNCNAQQAINRCIETIRSQHYYEFNLDKHRTNYNTISMDTPLGDGDDSNKTLGDTFVSAESDVLSDLLVKDFVQTYINKNKIVEAIILDSIIIGDVLKETTSSTKTVDESGNKTKIKRCSTEFWPFKLVKFVSNLPAGYEEYFTKKYKIALKDLNIALSAVKSANNQKLYKYLDNTLASARQNYIL